MILYHGSNTAIDGIDLNRCRPYKDFGKNSADVQRKPHSDYV